MKTDTKDTKQEILLKIYKSIILLNFTIAFSTICIGSLFAILFAILISDNPYIWIIIILIILIVLNSFLNKIDEAYLEVVKPIDEEYDLK